MADLTTLAKLADGGALVLVFALFIYCVYYAFQKVAPALKALQDAVLGLKDTVHSSQAVTEKLLEGNAQAFRELSSSNQNVASALALLTRTMEQSEGAMERHEQVSAYNFAVATNKVEENTKAIEGLRVDLTKHMTQCDVRYSARNNSHP